MSGCPTHGNACGPLCSLRGNPMAVAKYDPEPLNLRQREVIALERIVDTLDMFLVFFQRAHKL